MKANKKSVSSTVTASDKAVDKSSSNSKSKHVCENTFFAIFKTTILSLRLLFFKQKFFFNKRYFSEVFSYSTFL